MQIKIFSIPTYGGEELNKEMNRFLRAQKVLQLDSELVNDGSSSYWSFCIRYIEGGSVFTPTMSRPKVDYKKVLDAESYQRYKAYRDIRKKVATDEGIPAYLILTNEEMAELAKIKELTLEKASKIKGIGAKKVEKYVSFFIPKDNEI